MGPERAQARAVTDPRKRGRTSLSLSLFPAWRSLRSTPMLMRWSTCPIRDRNSYLGTIYAFATKPFLGEMATRASSTTPNTTPSRTDTKTRWAVTKRKRKRKRKTTSKYGSFLKEKKKNTLLFLKVRIVMEFPI